MIKNINSDIFAATEANVLLAQNNCFNIMSAGIAALIKQKFPEAYAADCLTKSGDPTKLGKYSIAAVANKASNYKYVVNIYGQFNYGTDRRYTNYDAVANAFERLLRDEKQIRQIKNLAGDIIPPVFAIPFKMGCNLAGGNWNIYHAIITELFKNESVFIFNL